ncbi:ABC transporter ATP-binding protein [Streptomyces sp. MK37H]|uniref:ABC transporter ATP-binding protein n=1 Tax=Streptomyces sp. MK37H TaxID=2699117 RepID=UPI0027E4FCDD|nr:ABC transporter ATP-binding protein [Streptomyces sp. MK37H]
MRDAIAEPLRVRGRPPAPGRIEELMKTVGLDVSVGGRLPHELSGGQCQRVGIARALAGEPRLLALDEPVSALDPSVRAGVLNLLTALQEDRGPAYLFLCHGLALVRHFAHGVAIMRRGRIVQTRPAREPSLTALGGPPA